MTLARVNCALEVADEVELGRGQARGVLRDFRRGGEIGRCNYTHLLRSERGRAPVDDLRFGRRQGVDEGVHGELDRAVRAALIREKPTPDHRFEFAEGGEGTVQTEEVPEGDVGEPRGVKSR